MDELLKHLTEVSIRQQQIMEHMASRQGETERELARTLCGSGPASSVAGPPHAGHPVVTPQTSGQDEKSPHHRGSCGGHRAGGCHPTPRSWGESLIQPAVLPPRAESKARLSITCVHGDTRQVPARRITITAPQGSWPVEAGIVEDPVSVLLGRDWPGFDRLLAAATQPVSPAGNRRRRKQKRNLRRRPVLLASDSARDDSSV